MQIYLNYKRYALVFTNESLEALRRPKYLEMLVKSDGSSLMFMPRNSKPKDGACFRVHKRVYEEQLSYAVGWDAPFISKIEQMFGHNVTIAAPADLVFVKDMVPAPAYNDTSANSHRKPKTDLVLRVDLENSATEFITTELLRVYADGCGPYDLVA